MVRTAAALTRQAPLDPERAERASLVLLRASIVEAFQKSHSVMRSSIRLAENLSHHMEYRANSSETAFLRNARRELQVALDTFDSVLSVVDPAGET